MPTDELSFPELYDAIRDLRADCDAPAGWHDAQRAALLTFIETGTVVVARAEHRADDADVLTLDSGPRPRPQHRAVVVLAVAAVVALLAAGLLAAPRWRSAEVPVPPATQPGTGTTDGVVPFPDLYPVLPAGHPMESRVTALYDGQLDWSNEPQSWMIVGRLVDDVVEQAIRISTTSDSPADVGTQLTGSPAGEPIDTLGAWTLYRNVNDVMDVAVGPLGPATLTVAGADPVGDMAAMGGLGSFVTVSVDAQGEPFLGVTSIPDDYRLIAGPESFVPGAMSARLTIPDGEGAPDPTMPDPVGDEGDGITVFVSMVDPFLMPIEGLVRVDIDGVDGWVSTNSGAPMVAWKVSATTWATVWDAADTDAAVEFARSLEFVDRATWEQRYAVPAPQYPAGPPPDSDPDGAALDRMLEAAGHTDLDRRSCAVIGVSPGNFDRRAEIDCGSDDGVRVGMPVVNAAGLVGKVTSVSLDTGVVMLITDPQFSVQVSIEGGGGQAVGVLQGSGADRHVPVMLIDAAVVTRGDVVTTAGGTDSLAPPDIPIGVVGDIDLAGLTVDVDVDVEPALRSGALTVVLYVPDREALLEPTATTEPPLVALEETGSIGTEMPIACGSVAPRDEPVEPVIVGVTPAAALAGFVEQMGIWRRGWIDQTSGDGPDAMHRFEYRREDGMLVTVVEVEAVDSGWAVTRWLSTPC